MTSTKLNRNTAGSYNWKYNPNKKGCPTNRTAPQAPWKRRRQFIGYGAISVDLFSLVLVTDRKVESHISEKLA